MKKILIFSVLLLFFPLFGTERTWASNSCVECHRKLETVEKLPTWYQDLFFHWYGSVHGMNGVTCDQCHGGDPNQEKKRKAHKGVFSSKKSKSPIYFKNIPETCGSCHSEVFKEFEKSLHYQNLKKDKLAPTCTTCHGFQMDIQDVMPLQIVGRCSICHNIDRRIKPEIPEQAKNILSINNVIRKKMQKTQLLIELGNQEGKNLKEAEALLKSAREKLKISGEHWHRFQLGDFQKELDAIQKLVDDANKIGQNAIFEK